jgi:uncharacterized protein YneR
VADGGDTINGFTTGDEVNFVFNTSNFMGASATGITSAFSYSIFALADSAMFVSGTDALTAITNTNDFWFYDTDDFVLYYDADGSGTADSAVAIASFDADVGLTASDIFFYS